MTQLFHNGQQSHGGDRKALEAITSTCPIRTLGSVSSFLEATLYQGNHVGTTSKSSKIISCRLSSGSELEKHVSKQCMPT